MRRPLPVHRRSTLNPQLLRAIPTTSAVFTSDEGDIGRGHMQRFQDVETRTPVILTTSRLLAAGLDAPTCRNIVLVRLVDSMVEFKQIIGRGTASATTTATSFNMLTTPAPPPQLRRPSLRRRSRLRHPGGIDEHQPEPKASKWKRRKNPRIPNPQKARSTTPSSPHRPRRRPG